MIRGNDLDWQEAFGSLLNAQDVLGSAAEGDAVSDVSVSEQSFHRALAKLHCTTPSGSMATVSVLPKAYSSRPTQAFVMGAAAEVRQKLCIIKGLIVPFEVLLVSL